MYWDIFEYASEQNGNGLSKSKSKYSGGSRVMIHTSRDPPEFGSLHFLSDTNCSNEVLSHWALETQGF